ncbi:MAG TPA: MarR family winged helix-turn-helix transcriptional regulator [Solirubrobacteraceae bacterium]|jgi:DNA-binding MarR family transcriptional regulator|nr:MarR family winged helix-turn-helix transcriptional regulator [Solirubrobacteraceae bacterium]
MASAPAVEPSVQESSGETATAPSQLTPALAELGLAFRHVFRTLSRLRGRDTHLGGSELSHAQFELLIELDERGELPAGELAAAARLTPATVTQMLDHLAACGHVERARLQTDRRVVVTRLTEQGRGKIEAKRLAWESRWLQALDGVAERDLRAATSVLERLGEMFEKAPAESELAASADGPRGGSQAAG